jgi:tetrahydromethanopterin S-methyltransferase subunit G
MPAAPILPEVLVPPQPRRSVDEARSLGEIARGLDTLVSRIDNLTDKIDSLSTTYTPREVHDLALGGVKVDLRRIDESLGKIDQRIDEAERETNRRFRQGVTLTISVFLGPLTIGLILYLLTQASR